MTDRKVQLATNKVTHTFLHVPDCPYPLLGRDLLTKLRAQIYFEGTGARITGPQGQPLHVLTLNLEDEYRLYEPEKNQNLMMTYWLEKFPYAWAETGGMGLAIQQAPLVIPLKATATPISSSTPCPTRPTKEFAPILGDCWTRGYWFPASLPGTLPSFQ